MSRRLVTLFAVLSFSCLENSTRAASFRDDFDVLSDNWIVSTDRKLGATQWQRDHVSVRDGMLVLKHSVKGNQMNGAELAWKHKVHYGTLTARIKGGQASGVLSTLFLYGWYEGKTHEIDVVEAFPDEKERPHLTVYMDWVEKDGYVLGPHRDHLQPTIRGYDSRAWHIYSVRWEHKKVTWFIDGKQVFSSARVVPFKPVSIMLNTWHPPTWAKAKPRGDSEQWVDWLEWREISDEGQSE